MEYTNLIYKTECNLHVLKDTLQHIYDFLYVMEHMLYEVNLIQDRAVMQTITEILYAVKQNRQQNDILMVIKTCINALNIRIRYETLYQHVTECGKIIIMKDHFFDCTLSGYLQRIHQRYGGV